jgi:hypothetical protein
MYAAALALDTLLEVKASKPHAAAATAPAINAAVCGAAATEVFLAAQRNNRGPCERQQEQEQQTLQHHIFEVGLPVEVCSDAVNP